MSLIVVAVFGLLIYKYGVGEIPPTWMLLTALGVFLSGIILARLSKPF